MAGDRVNVLVTGGAGYVGAHACKALAEAGFQPVVYDDFSRGHRDFVRWGPAIEGDVRNAEALETAIRTHSAQAILHFAAKAEVAESLQAPALYFDVNIGGAVAIVQAAAATDVRSLIFSSTCAVYGAPGVSPIPESAPRQPINPYGFSKLAAERLFQDAESAHGLRTIALRYFNAAGAEPEATIGERHSPETHLIPLAIRAAMPGDFTLQIFGEDYPTPDGTPLRDYVHVADLAAAHVLALRRLLGGGGSAAFNLGVGRGYSVKEIVAAAASVAGRPARARSAPRRAGDPPELVADASAVKAALGWRPAHADILDIVGDAYRWAMREAAA